MFVFYAGHVHINRNGGVLKASPKLVLNKI